MARLAMNTTRAHIPLIWTRSTETAALIRSHGFTPTHDVDELIGHPDVDAVAVLSPNALHVEHCRKVAQAGKALLATKPLAPTLEECDRIIEAVDCAGITQHLDMSLRFSPPMRFLLEMMDSGTLGDPLHLIHRTSRATGLYSTGRPHKAILHPEVSGGWIIHHMCHQVDYALRLIRRPVRQVYARGVRSDAACPSDESVTALIEFEGGAMAEITDGVTLMDDHHFSLLTSQAQVSVDASRCLRMRRAEDMDATATPGYGGRSVCYTPEGWQDDSLVAFLSAVSGRPHGRPYALQTIPLREARPVMRVLLAIKQSAETGQPVSLDSPP